MFEIYLLVAIVVGGFFALEARGVMEIILIAILAVLWPAVAICVLAFIVWFTWWLMLERNRILDSRRK